MYTCECCDFESEEIRNPVTLQYLFVGSKCRTCYYRKWATEVEESRFGCTMPEERHYYEVGYDPQKVQDIILQGLLSHR